MLYVGTSGYSYKDWCGMFYPEGAKAQQYLPLYAEKFPCVEINYTYYRQPVPRTMASMVERVCSDFRFTVKAHRTLTHDIPSVTELKKEIDTFWNGVRPMYDAGKLGCTLFQFPWSFRFSERNLEYVRSLRNMFPGEKVVEFRNKSWAKPQVYHALAESGLGFCCVDEPALRSLFPRVVQVTSKVAYLRFHGRNAEKWFNHKEAWERYDYLYSDEELKGWLPKIREMNSAATHTFVLFNNCHQGQAAQNAIRMQELLLTSSSEA